MPRTVLLWLLLIAAPLLMAQDRPASKSPRTAAQGQPEACSHPVDILWNEEARSEPGTMAVSVKNGKSGQQVPRIPPEAFSLTLDEDGEVAAKIIELSQSKSALQRLPNKRGSMRHSIETDPVSYDAFFTVDLSRSMDLPRAQREGPDRSYRDLAVSLIRKITEGESRDQGGVL